MLGRTNRDNARPLTFRIHPDAGCDIRAYSGGDEVAAGYVLIAKQKPPPGVEVGQWLPERWAMIRKSGTTVAARREQGLRLDGLSSALTPATNGNGFVMLPQHCASAAEEARIMSIEDQREHCATAPPP
jgi:hypothetical protein